MTSNLLGAPAILHVDRVRLRPAPGGRILCRGLSFTAAPGERWALLGPNGAGKSTLLVAIAGLLAPESGSIRLGDLPVSRWRRDSLARQRTWCPQFWMDPFPMSAWETVAAAVLATQPECDGATVEETARHWLRELDAGGLADHDVRHLSGGERQRVALATAFAQRAPLLLLDEPTSHLDWTHQDRVRRLLLRWSEKSGTALVAMHDVSLAWSFATHALLLDGRGGALSGPRDQVLTADAVGGAFGVAVSIRDDAGMRWFRVHPEERP